MLEGREDRPDARMADHCVGTRQVMDEPIVFQIGYTGRAVRVGDRVAALDDEVILDPAQGVE